MKKSLTFSKRRIIIWLVARYAKREEEDNLVNVNKLKAKLVELGTNVDELTSKIEMRRDTF